MKMQWYNVEQRRRFNTKKEEKKNSTNDTGEIRNTRTYHLDKRRRYQLPNEQKATNKKAPPYGKCLSHMRKSCKKYERRGRAKNIRTTNTIVRVSLCKPFYLFCPFLNNVRQNKAESFRWQKNIRKMLLNNLALLPVAYNARSQLLACANRKSR